MMNRKEPNVFAHLIAIAVLPFTAIVAVPAILLTRTSGLNGIWGWEYPFPALQAAGGGAVIAVGFGMLVWTIALFATVGGGTLAPWQPPGRLVVRGIYRHVRNPMISAVILVLLGESALFGSAAVLAWCGFFFVGNVVYFKFSEEPGLVRRFGDEYLEYKRNVPRWIPRLRPWAGTDRAQ
jgi:protein-S-isoprenylcysteine O-methyltransferase Ste14